jgi:hypothetical protein
VGRVVSIGCAIVLTKALAKTLRTRTAPSRWVGAAATLGDNVAVQTRAWI